MRVGYFRLITISVDDYLHAKELRDAVGAHWPFLCDFERQAIQRLNIVDVTDKRYSPVAIPYTFVLHGDRQIHKIYNGWWLVGRPTVEELREDFRTILAHRPDWAYDDNWNYSVLPEAQKNPDLLEGTH